MHEDSLAMSNGSHGFEKAPKLKSLYLACTYKHSLAKQLSIELSLLTLLVFNATDSTGQRVPIVSSRPGQTVFSKVLSTKLIKWSERPIQERSWDSALVVMRLLIFLSSSDVIKTPFRRVNVLGENNKAFPWQPPMRWCELR